MRWPLAMVDTLLYDSVTLRTLASPLGPNTLQFLIIATYSYEHSCHLGTSRCNRPCTTRFFGKSGAVRVLPRSYAAFSTSEAEWRSCRGRGGPRNHNHASDSGAFAWSVTRGDDESARHFSPPRVARRGPIGARSPPETTRGRGCHYRGELPRTCLPRGPSSASSTRPETCGPRSTSPEDHGPPNRHSGRRGS